MHQHIPGRMISLHFAVYAQCSVATHAVQLHLQVRMQRTWAENFGFFQKFCSLVFMGKSIVVMGVIATDAKVGILGLAVLPG